MREIIERSARMIHREIENNSDLHQLTRNDQYSRACMATINTAISFIANEFRDAYQTPISSACESALKIQEAESIITVLASYLGNPQTVIAVQQNHVAALTITNISDWLKNTLSPWIKGLGGTLWAYLSQNISVKEWKVSGGVGGAFGLVNASLEITFDSLPINPGGGQGYP